MGLRPINAVVFGAGHRYHRLNDPQPNARGSNLGEKNSMIRGFAVGILALSLGGCASILSGTSQEVMVNTNPAGANCAINRQSATIARINPTPAAATISKTKYDITIVCDKDGYQQATYIDHSGIQPATWGNIVAGGLIGWGIDSASGADDHYDSPVNITLVPNIAGTPGPAAANTSNASMPASAASETPKK